jgi:hypothetical protein
MADVEFFLLGLKSVDKDVREEIADVLETCKSTSEMDDFGHPKNTQFENGVYWLTQLLRET